MVPLDDEAATRVLTWGGTGPDSICELGKCKPEHERGVMRNNLIVNCPADVGVYVNAGADTKILNNTLYNTTGIDMRSCVYWASW